MNRMFVLTPWLYGLVVSELRPTLKVRALSGHLDLRHTSVELFPIWFSRNSIDRFERGRIERYATPKGAATLHIGGLEGERARNGHGHQVGAFREGSKSDATDRLRNGERGEGAATKGSRVDFGHGGRDGHVAAERYTVHEGTLANLGDAVGKVDGR